MKTKLVTVMIVLLVGVITYHPVMASGVVTTCSEASLVTALAGGGVVDFNIGMGCQIIFTSEKVINVNTTVRNTSEFGVTFSGDMNTRLFTVNSGISLTLDNLTLQGGKALFGGAIYNNGGNLTISDSRFLYNKSTETTSDNPGGGAIYNFYGNLNVTNTIFHDNLSNNKGGAIFSEGFTENLIESSDFTNNTSTPEASAIFIVPELLEGSFSPIGQTIIHDSYFSDNSSNIQIYEAVSEISGNTFVGSSTYAVGVIYTGSSIIVSDNIFIDHTVFTPLLIDTYANTSFSIERNYFINNTVDAFDCSAFSITSMEIDNTLTGNVSNNTFYGNGSGSNRATICISSNVIMDLAHNTFLDNNIPTGNNLKLTSGANIVTARGNIFAGGSCVVAVDGGSFIDGGNNIAYNATGCVGANVDPQLIPFTYALVPSSTSPAVNAYSAPCVVSDDQFGTTRPLAGMCDIGAIEGSASPNTTVTMCSESALNLALAGGGVVDFNIGTDCEIIFTSEKVISVNTTIQNTSAHAVVFNGNDLTRFFTVNSGISLTLDNLTLQNGEALSGGAIYNNGGILTIIDSIFVRNDAMQDGRPSGGAIYTINGTLTINKSYFDDNLALFGAAIQGEFSNITVTNSKFTDNISGYGVIFSSDSLVVIDNSEFVSNEIAYAGVVYYAVIDTNNQVTITDSLFLDNSTWQGGTVSISGQVANPPIVPEDKTVLISIERNRFIRNINTTTEYDCSALLIAESTIGAVANNTFFGNSTFADGGVVCIGSSEVAVKNNTFVNSSFPTGGIMLIWDDVVVSSNIFLDGGCIISQLGGSFIDGGNNIAYNATGCVGANVDPQLNPMFNYAFVPAPTSPAVNAYSAPCAVSDDQFGTTRPLGGMCDIGAIEGSVSPNTTVTTCSESALNLALAGGGTVDFNIGADCTIPFTFEKIISTNMTVQNTSLFRVTFTGGNQVRLFTVNNGASLTLDNLYLIEANSIYGGAVFNDESMLNVINSFFVNNSAPTNATNGDILNWGHGGAIYSFGEATTTITRTDFYNNRATFGGAISVQPRWDNVTSQFYYSEVIITSSVFNNNSAVNSGAIAASGTLTLDQNVFEGNVAEVASSIQYSGSESTESITLTNNMFINHTGDYFGGALAIWAIGGQTNFSVRGNQFIYNSTSNIYVPCSALTLWDEPGGSQLIGDVTNNTFSGNNSLGNSHAACIKDDDGIINLTHNTFTDNNTPSGKNLYVALGAVTARGNIFQDGDCTLDFGGQITDGGNNIAYNATGCVGANINPQLGELTAEFAHIPANNAIEYAPACHVATDQIGENRPVGTLCTPGSVDIIGDPAQTVTVEFSSASGNATENSNVGTVLRVTTGDSTPTDYVATVNVLVNNITTDANDYNLLGTVIIPTGTAHNALISIDSAITIVDDAIDEANESFQLTLTAPLGAILGTQTTYTHMINDDDTAGYNLNTTSVTNISEPNISTTFLILLTSEPTGTAILDFGTTDNTECVVSPATFTFDNTNWNGNQTITITAQDDALVDGTQPCAVTISRNANSTASEYASVANPTNVSVQVADDDVPIVERNLVINENELLAILQAQASANTQFFIADITPTTISIVMSYSGEYGQVIITVNDADFTRFSITSVTNLTGGAVSSTFSSYVYPELVNVLMVGIDTWIEDVVAPATAVIKAITITADVITITVDVSN